MAANLKQVRKWEKSVSQKRPDTFHVPVEKAFLPTYEKKWTKPDMKMIVGMEYRRLWFDERTMWQRQHYTPQERGCFLRKYLPKDLWKKGQVCMNAPPPPLLKMKRFLKIPAKVDTGLGCLATELVPQCSKCSHFHSALEKCAATKHCDIKQIKATALKSVP